MGFAIASSFGLTSALLGHKDSGGAAAQAKSTAPQAVMVDAAPTTVVLGDVSGDFGDRGDGWVRCSYKYTATNYASDRARFDAYIDFVDKSGAVIESKVDTFNSVAAGQSAEFAERRS